MADFGQYGKRRRVSGGIEAQTKRGAFGQTWWGRQFVVTMEKLSDPGRLARGKTYARSGQVLTMTIGRSVISGEVQGSQVDPFAASVTVDPLTDEDLEAVFEQVRTTPGMLAELASGIIPRVLGPLLLPSSPRQLDFDCTCPDDGRPCKHVAALMYVAAESIDTSSVGILTLRGLDLDALITGIGETEEEPDMSDFFGDRRVLPGLPRPEFHAAMDDLDAVLLRKALRNGDVDEALVSQGIKDLRGFYRRLGE